jgi:outer membrane protein
MRELTLLTALLVTSSSASSGESHTLEIEVRFPGGVGEVRMAVFASAEGFPRGRELAAHKAGAQMVEGTAVLRFEGVEPGEYAAIGFLDVDGDAEVTKNWIGFPLEPVGATGSWSRRGPPAFEACAFTLPTPTNSTPHRLVVDLYLL